MTFENICFFNLYDNTYISRFTYFHNNGKMCISKTYNSWNYKKIRTYHSTNNFKIKQEYWKHMIIEIIFPEQEHICSHNKNQFKITPLTMKKLQLSTSLYWKFRVIGFSYIIIQITVTMDLFLSQLLYPNDNTPINLLYINSLHKNHIGISNNIHNTNNILLNTHIHSYKNDNLSIGNNIHNMHNMLPRTAIDTKLWQ